VLSGFELPLEPRLPRIGSVDEVAVEERAASLARRSIKRESKLFALELAIRMTDLTTQSRLPLFSGRPIVRADFQPISIFRDTFRTQFASHI
jgi:hypothetical protein